METLRRQQHYSPSSARIPIWTSETQFVEAVHDWAASMNKRHQIDLILLDFSEAFDCVPHQRRLNKLSYNGIAGSTLYFPG